MREFFSQEVVNGTKQIFGEYLQALSAIMVPLQFQSEKDWKFEYHMSSPRYPQSNGMAEQCIESKKSAMKKASQ